MKNNYEITIVGFIIFIVLISAVVSTGNSGCDVPSFLQKGDMVFMDIKPNIAEKTSYSVGYSNDHVEMYLGHEYGDGSKFLGATHSGVRIISWSNLTALAQNFTYYRVVACSAQINKSCAFALGRLGAPYQYPIKDYVRKIKNPDYPHRTANKWSCSELIWAAYYNAGIDIDHNRWSIFPWGVPAITIGSPFIFTRNEITSSRNVFQITES